MIKNTNNIYKIVMNNSYEKKLQESEKLHRRTLEEKGYSSELNLRGRKSFFEEYFDGIKLDEQILPKVGIFENIAETESFQTGRQRAMFLIRNGFTLEEYNNFLVAFEEKFSIKNKTKHR